MGVGASASKRPPEKFEEALCFSGTSQDAAISSTVPMWKSEFFSTDLLLVEASFSENVGMMIIPHVWKNIRCAKPPTNIDGRGTEMESLLNLGLFQCENRGNSR